MGRYEEVRQDQTEAFNRIRDLETFKASHSTQMGNLEDLMRQFIDKFAKHDEKEMMKYDMYDKHVQDLNITLREVQNDVKEIKSKHSQHDGAMEKCKENFEEYKKEVSDELKAIWAKINKWLGAITFAGIIGTVGYSYWEHRENTDRELREQLIKMERENAMNYGRQQMMMYGKANSE